MFNIETLNILIALLKKGIEPEIILKLTIEDSNIHKVTKTLLDGMNQKKEKHIDIYA